MKLYNMAGSRPIHFDSEIVSFSDEEETEDDQEKEWENWCDLEDVFIWTEIKQIQPLEILVN